ncbi:MAG: FRG domain-containing protein [Chloroflexi bacterium]|nr:FRG domain-containing protein [Chloroflexota bacterium]
MPNELRTKTVQTLQEFTDLIESIRGDSPLWYRGCGKSSYPLLPTLYRHPVIHEIADLIGMETAILSHFKQRSVPYLTRNLPNDWEFLFLMQHFGVPTRLLDWTENPFIALYFAITSAPSSFGSEGTEFLEDAALWMINPVSWNRHVLQYLSFAGGVLSVDDAQLSGYTPGGEGLMNKEAVALFGIHNSPRIVAQRGVFTIFWAEHDSYGECLCRG